MFHGMMQHWLYLLDELAKRCWEADYAEPNYYDEEGRRYG